MAHFVAYTKHFFPCELVVKRNLRANESSLFSGEEETETEHAIKTFLH